MKWGINRGDKSTKESELITRFFENDLDVYKLISDILDSIWYGYQPIEIVWNKSDSYLMPMKIQAKPPEWFVFGQENELRFRTKENYFEGIELPNKKFLIPQYMPSYNNPYGERVAARCFWPATFKKGGLKFWVIFTEKYGMPAIIGKVPKSSAQSEYDRLAELLEDLLQDSVSVVPDDSSVEIKEASGKNASADIYKKLIDTCNSMISKAVLGQTLTTEVGSTGSYAASKTHQEVRQDIIDDDKRLVENTINLLISWICDLNFPNANHPKFELYGEDTVDDKLAQRDKTLREAGVKFSKKYFRKAYGFDEEDIIEIEDNDNKKTSDKSKFNESLTAVKFKQDDILEKDPIQDQIDDLIDSFDDKTLQKQIEPVVDPLIQMILSSGSYDEMLKKFASVYPDMNSKDLEDTLTKAIFYSDIWGRVHGDPDKQE